MLKALVKHCSTASTNKLSQIPVIPVMLRVNDDRKQTFDNVHTLLYVLKHLILIFHIAPVMQKLMKESPPTKLLCTCKNTSSCCFPFTSSLPACTKPRLNICGIKFPLLSGDGSRENLQRSLKILLQHIGMVLGKAKTQLEIKLANNTVYNERLSKSVTSKE